LIEYYIISNTRNQNNYFNVIKINLMIKTTKYFIVVIIAFVLSHTTAYAQYNGGSGDGAHTDYLNVTACTDPPHFYAYFGGSGDGAVTDILNQTVCGTPTTFYAYFGGAGDGGQTNMLMNTTCGTPPQYFAYMGGLGDGATADQLNLTTCSTPPQFYAYLGGSGDGSVNDMLTLTACATPSQYYAFMGGPGDGFSSDAKINCSSVPPVADFSANSTSVCVGSTVVFTDLSTDGPTAWNWAFNGGTPTTSTQQNPSVIYNTPGVYNVSLTAINPNGSNTKTITGYITVNAIPTANAGTDVSFCSGSSATLNASGGTSYNWLPATGLSSASIANPVANPTTTTNYTVTVTSAGCSATDVVIVTVNSLPTISVSPITICAGGSGTLTASGASTYQWAPSTGLSAISGTSVTANPATTTTYTVYGYTAAGCSNTTTVTVTVNPTPTANAGTDVSFCSGSSATLNASGGTSYSWLPATGLSSTSIANPIANPTTTTNYTVTVTSAGCSATDVVVVTVNSLPTVSVSPITICAGGSGTLTASGASTYQWAPSTGLSAISGTSVTANPATTTTYTVYGYTAAGCSNTTTVTVTVNAAPVANAGNDISICNGSSTTLLASGGSSYSWSPATGLNNDLISNPDASPSSTTTYTVTVSNGGCSATDLITVTVNQLPVVSVSANGPTTFCSGGNVTLTSSAAASYLWSNGDVTQSTVITTSGNYYVTATSSFGCSATSGVTGVTVNSPVPASINPGGPTTVCQGNSVTLVANNGNAYSWSTTETTQIISVSVSGTYSVTVTDIYGCGTSTASLSVTVNPNPATPVITAGGSTDICIGDTVLISSDAASSYLWSTGATTSSIYATAGGSYSVINYNSFGCGTTSSSITVNVNDPLTDFTASTQLAFIPPALVNFTATTSGVPPYTYLWNFGDTTTSVSSAPSHNYVTIGYKTVSLTLTDSTGCSKTVTKPGYIEVEQLFPSWSMITGTTLDLTGVSFIDAVTGIMTMSDGNCLISLDSGNNWSPLPTGNLEPLTGASIIPGNWFVTGENGTILLSTNNGSSWTPFNTGTIEKFNGSSFSSAASGFAVGTNGTIQKYNGVSWIPESSGTGEHLNNVFALSDVLAFAVGDNQTILKYNGVSWVPQSTPGAVGSFHVKDIKFTSALEGYAAGTNGIIIKTIDGGNNWTPALTGVDIDFNSVEAVAPDSAWATGTNGIVYTTTDNGANWIRYSVGYTADQDEIIVTNGKGHVTGQGGNGRNFGEGRSAISVNTPEIISAINNFNVSPNPANDAFTISATLSDVENLTIEIKDASGKLIEHIVNSNVSGKFSKSITTENYRQGVYFIHIREGEKSWVQKLVIVK
jgi:PKD repeat protein